MAEPPRRGRGTQIPGANRDRRDGEPNAEPDSSPRRPNGLLRGTRDPAVSLLDVAPATRGRAQPRPRHGRVDRGRGDGWPWSRPCSRRSPAAAASSRSGWPPSPPHRSSRTCWAPSPAGSGRGRGNQLALIRAGGAAALLAARRVRERAGDDRGLDRLLAQPVVRRPVPPAPVGRDVPGPAARSGRRASSALGEPPPAPSRPSSAASSPTGSVARRRSRWPAWSGSSAAIGYVGLRSPDADDRRRSRRATRSAPCATRPILGRIALAQGFYGGGLIAAVPLYAIVNVDRLDLTLSDVGIIGILTAAATTVSFLVWGAVVGPVRGDGRDAARQRDRPRGARRLRARARRRRAVGRGDRRGGGQRLDRRRDRLGRQRPHLALVRGRRRWPAGTRSPGARGIVAAFR